MLKALQRLDFCSQEETRGEFRLGWWTLRMAKTTKAEISLGFGGWTVLRLALPPNNGGILNLAAKLVPLSRIPPTSGTAFHLLTSARLEVDSPPTLSRLVPENGTRSASLRAGQ